MAYSQYANSGKSLGKILYCLDKIGIPLHVVESVILQSERTDNDEAILHYCSKEFAVVKEWIDVGGEPMPVFEFVGYGKDSYNRLQKFKMEAWKGLGLE